MDYNGRLGLIGLAWVGSTSLYDKIHKAPASLREASWTPCSRPYKLRKNLKTSLKHVIKAAMLHTALLSALGNEPDKAPTTTPQAFRNPQTFWKHALKSPINTCKNLRMPYLIVPVQSVQSTVYRPSSSLVNIFKKLANK